MVLDPVTVRPNDTLRTSLEVMRRHDISGMPVVDGKRPRRHLDEPRRALRNESRSAVERLMTKTLVTVSPSVKQKKRGASCTRSASKSCSS